jgi:hypothetical protein
MENFEEEIKKVNAALNHLNEEDQVFVLLNEASKIGTKEWQSDVLDLMKRMNLIP